MLFLLWHQPRSNRYIRSLFGTNHLPNGKRTVSQEEKSVEQKLDFDSMSVSELKSYAKENGIDIKGLSYKDEILAAVKSASAE